MYLAITCCQSHLHWSMSHFVTSQRVMESTHYAFIHHTNTCKLTFIRNLISINSSYKFKLLVYFWFVQVYHGMTKPSSDGFMGCFVVFGCLAHTFSWIAFSYHSFYRHVWIFMHFGNNLMQFYHQSMRSTHNKVISIKMLNKFYNVRFVFIIWSRSKW